MLDLRKTILAFFLALAMAIWLFSMAGCDTTKRAERRQDHILRTHPNVAFIAIRKIAPCVTLSADTIINTTDTTILIDCPDPANTSYFTSFIHDTLNTFTQGKTIRVPVTLPVKTVTIVKDIEDLSRVAEMDNLRIAAVQRGDTLQIKLTWWRIHWWIFYLAGLATIPLISLIIKLAKRTI